MFHSILEIHKYLSNKNEAKKEIKRLVEKDSILDKIYRLKIYRWFLVASLKRTV